jgi:hypothetical protein
MYRTFDTSIVYSSLKAESEHKGSEKFGGKQYIAERAQSDSRSSKIR